MDRCAKCKVREVEYDIEGGICANCWIDWWVDGMGLKGREKEDYRRVAQTQAGLAQLVERGLDTPEAVSSTLTPCTNTDG